ncbi:hypothetical protein OOZ15_09480 [Galbibacter sp. EGI 63066]|uniref:tetratricopeptide repeat protein n=1 Tax=Galbibacter sp. EGI 63066 TaxID=2993559 RepID=UPI0022487AA4|nr:hypothetical protein [Galbibacter sp. EGI 63066]MCX2680167.1 hypothetical protein [Galbibacter sp. EGI 63066]
METTLHNIYLFKALDAYPYDLGETVESLNYALSYDSKNVEALCLLAKLYTYQLKDYEAAKNIYAEALAAGMESPLVYPGYVHVLLLNEEYEEAHKLADFALKVKGTDKTVLKLLKGLLYESQANYKKAKKSYKEALQLSIDNSFVTHVEGELNRVEKKVKRIQKKKKKKVKKLPGKKKSNKKRKEK